MSLAALVEYHARRRRSAVAVEVDNPTGTGGSGGGPGNRGERLTFGGLDRRSNRLARALVRLGVRPGERVALLCCAQHATDLLVGYLAIQKAGAAAVRLDPATGTGLAAVKPRVTLACAEGAQGWQAGGAPGLLVADASGARWWKALELREPPTPLGVPARPGAVAEIVVREDSCTDLTHEEVLARMTTAHVPAGGTLLHAVELTGPAFHPLSLGTAASGGRQLVQAPLDPVRFAALVAGGEAIAACLAPADVAVLPPGSEWTATAAGLCWWHANGPAATPERRGYCLSA